MKKRLLRQIVLGTIFLLSFGLISTSTPQTPIGSRIVQADNKISETDNGTLVFKKTLQLSLGDKDKLGRATAAHIQLQDKDEPTKKRDKKIKYNPVGWHNYKFYFEDGSKKAWLMNRGHLIAYQFSGLNNEGKNLVPMTAWLNTGNYKGTNADNQDSMLFYENKLDSWLSLHPNYWLDYKVTPIYEGDELIPRQIELQYVGIDKDGQLLSIELGGKETKDDNQITHVILDNVSPNASLNYATGTATSTVKSASGQAADRKAEEERQAAEAAAAQKAEEERQAAEAAAAQKAEEERQAAEAAAAQAQAEAEAQAQAAAQAQVNSGGGYTRDAKGRWHRSNGQYASKAEIAAAGLPW